MKKLIPTSIVPSGGYTYTQEETGHKLMADSFTQLVTRVIAHRKANNLPIPFNIEDVVEEDLCAQRGELCESVESPNKPLSGQPLTLDSVVRVTRTLFAAGKPQGCTGCRSSLVKKAISFIVGARKTPHDDQLHSCKHCGCFNAAQIWIPKNALQKTITKAENESLPEHCWKKV